MSVQDLCMIAAVICLIWGIIVMVQVSRKISPKGIKPILLLFDIFIMKYLAAYRRITLEEKGRIGHMYYQFFIAIWLAVVFALAFIYFTLS